MGALYRNMSFVRLFLGRLVTNVGDSLYYVGAMWLVWELTESPLYTGLAGFLVQLPTSFQFLVGPLVDRWKLDRVLVRTQLVQGVCVLLVPLAAAMGHLSVWVVLLVMPILSLLNQFVYPAQNAALPRIVSDDQLVRANSLFSTAYQGTEVVFNAVGGLAIAVVGATALFVVDSVTFVIASVLFLGVTVPAVGKNDPDAEPDENYLADLWAGFTYLRGSVVLWIVAGAMVSNVGGAAMLAVLPAFADSLGGPETYGLLMGAIAGGALVGALVSSLVEDRPFGRVAIVGYVFAGLSFLGAVAVPGPLGTAALLFLGVVPVGTTNVMYASMLQSSVADGLVGRVTSTSQSLTAAMMPLGNLLGGAVAEAFGPGSVMYGLVGGFVLLGLYCLAHPRIRSLPSVEEVDEATLGLGGRRARGESAPGVSRAR